MRHFSIVSRPRRGEVRRSVHGPWRGRAKSDTNSAQLIDFRLVAVSVRRLRSSSRLQTAGQATKGNCCPAWERACLRSDPGPRAALAAGAVVIPCAGDGQVSFTDRGSDDDERMGYLRVPLVLGALAVVIGGCGSGSARTAAADAQVETGSCQSSGAGGHVVSQSCSFVLNDGQQFRCRQAFEGQTPTARVLEHTKGCVRLRSLVLSPAVRRMIAALDKVRSCLTAKAYACSGLRCCRPIHPAQVAQMARLSLGEAPLTSCSSLFIPMPPELSGCKPR